MVNLAHFEEISDFLRCLILSQGFADFHQSQLIGISAHFKIIDTLKNIVPHLKKILKITNDNFKFHYEFNN